MNVLGCEWGGVMSDESLCLGDSFSQKTEMENKRENKYSNRCFFVTFFGNFTKKRYICGVKTKKNDNYCSTSSSPSLRQPGGELQSSMCALMREVQ